MNPQKPEARRLPHLGHAAELARELSEFTITQLTAVHEAAADIEPETRKAQYLALARSDIEAMLTVLDEMRALVLV